MKFHVSFMKKKKKVQALHHLICFDKIPLRWPGLYSGTNKEKFSSSINYPDIKMCMKTDKKLGIIIKVL